MKILYLAHRLPYPPDKGEKTRAFYQIQQLAGRHTIHLCTFVDDRDDLPHVPALREYCASIDVVYRGNAATFFRTAAAFLRRYPLSVSLFYRKALAQRVVQKLATERFDCAVASSSSMAQYACLTSNLPKVIDFIDVDSEKWRLYAQRRSFPLSAIYRLEAKRLAAYEQTVAGVFDHCVLISDDEARLLRQRANDRPISVISNGVDLAYFSPSGVPFRDVTQPTIVFTGVMDYFPNTDAVQYFCREIFPRVLAAVPEARFDIVGRHPTAAVRKLASPPHVVVTGQVPDVRPYLTQARVAVAPFRLARGVQNKVLESMAMGLPVVGTAEAFKGIAATERDGIRIAEDPVSFARQVTAFLPSDTALRSQSALQARRYVERHHRWEDQGAKLERVLEEVVWKNAEGRSLAAKSAVRA